MAVKFASSSRRNGVQDLFHRRSSGGGGSVSSRKSSISSSKRSSNKSSKRGRQASNRSRSRTRSRSRSRTRSNSKQRQRLRNDENDITNNLIVNKSFEQKLTQDVESISAQHKQRSHPSSSKSNTKQHRRRHTADSTTTKSTKSSSTAPTYCHDGIDLLFSDVISPLSGAICTFLTTCLCDDNLIDCAGDDKDDRHLYRVSSPRVNSQIVNRRIPQRSSRDEKILVGSRRRVSPTVNGVVLKQEEYNVLPQPTEGAAVVVEEEEVIMYY